MKKEIGKEKGSMKKEIGKEERKHEKRNRSTDIKCQ